jgi:cell division protein FtsI (penicillin-binding protein 3)
MATEPNDIRVRSAAPPPKRGVRRFRVAHAGAGAMEVARSRVLVTALLFVMGFVVMSARLLDLGFFERVVETAVADRGRAAVLTARADIVDRNGVVLATNLKTASLYADPKRVLDAEDAADKLLLALPTLNRAEVLARLKADGRFSWIKRGLTPEEKYRVNSLGIPGLGFEDEDRRVYPQGRLAAHVLGFVDIDGNGLQGVERFFNSRLGNPHSLNEPLRLAIDVRVQHVLRAALVDAVDTFSALGAAGLVMDVATGEVLAMVSLPDFDPNDPAATRKEALFNRVTQGVYELGSGFKTFTVAMALDSGHATVESHYDATKPLRIARFTINDFHGKARMMSLPEVFIHSSNIGTARMAMEMGTDMQRDYLNKLGLFQRPAIELVEASPPLLPNPWREISTVTVAYGHGIAITPLHLATGMAAVVNGGHLVPSTLVMRDEVEAATQATRVLSQRASDTMRKLLRLAVIEGTGGKADVPGYEVGGKTGTAEKSVAGGYDRKALLSSFVGVFPTSAPRYVVLAIVDEPKPTAETYGYATGGWTAAPAVATVVRKIAPMLGVPPQDDTDNALRSAFLLPVKDE